MSQMTEIHRGLLQHIMKVGSIGQTEFQTLLTSLKNDGEVETKDSTIEDFLASINSNIGQFDMRIQTIVHPKNKKTYSGLINQADDEISKLATQFTPHELVLFKKIVCEVNLILVGTDCRKR
jgi:hypothetical protein